MPGRSDIEAGRAYVELLLKGEGFQKGLEAAKSQLHAFSGGITAIGASLFAAGAAMRGALLGALTVFAETGEQLDILSKRTGISAGALAELEYAARQSGLSMESVEVAIRKMQKTLGDAELYGKKGSDALRLIGLSAGDLVKLSPDQQFQKIADSIAKIPDQALRAKAATDLWGRSGTVMLPMIENLRALRQEARDLHLIPKSDDIRLARETADAFKRLVDLVKMTTFEIGAALAPAFLRTAEVIQKALVQINDFIDTHRQLIVVASGVATALLLVGGALLGVTAAVKVLQVAFSGVTTIISGVISLFGFLLSPMGLIIAGLGAAAFAFFKFTKAGQDAAASIGKILGDIYADFQETFGGISDAISAGDFALAGEIAMAGLKLVWTEGWDWIKNSFFKVWAAIKITFFEGARFLADAWSVVWVAMQNTWEFFQTFFGTGLINFLAFVKSTWAATINGLKILWIEIWSGIMTFFDKAIATLLEGLAAFIQAVPTGHEILVAFTGQDERDYQKAAKALRDKAAGHKTDADAAKAAAKEEQDAIEKTRRMAVDALEDREAKDKAAREKKLQEDIAARQKILDDMRADAAKIGKEENPEIAEQRKKLEELRKRAAEEKAAADKERDRKEREKPPPVVPGGEGTPLPAKMETVGTFSGAAAILLGGGGGPVDQLKKMNGKLDVMIIAGNENTDKIVNAVGGTFK
jgi:hypothetical protein